MQGPQVPYLRPGACLGDGFL